MSSREKIPSIQMDESAKEDNIGLDLNEMIKKLLEKMSIIQNKGIEKVPSEEIEELLDMVDTLLADCDVSQSVQFNRNEDIIRLLYRYQNLSLKYENYKIEKNLRNIEEEQEKILKQNETIMQENHNLIYTILSFILSFSVISASVEAIRGLNDTGQVSMFMIFMMSLLVLGLIILDNFYGNRKKEGKLLYNNHFILFVLLSILLSFWIIHFLKNTLF